MKRGVIAAISVGLVLMIAGAAFGINPDDLNRVTFVNETGYDIIYLFFSPGDSDHWGADILGTTRTLDAGKKLGFYIHYPDYSDTFDFLAIDEDGDAYIIWDYEINDDQSAVIEITMDAYEGDYDMPDLTTVNLMNSTGYEIYYAFFSPSDSQMWGIDMLDKNTTLLDGDTLSLYVPVTSDTSSYDFAGLDEDEDEYQFSVDISNEQDEYNWTIELSDLQ